jgi:hypothetical protein
VAAVRAAVVHDALAVRLAAAQQASLGVFDRERRELLMLRESVEVAGGEVSTRVGLRRNSSIVGRLVGRGSRVVIWQRNFKCCDYNARSEVTLSPGLLTKILKAWFVSMVSLALTSNVCFFFV